jgi:AcrR family transcriptional regulator
MVTDTTADRIIESALASFLDVGVKKTGIADVAYRAGLTRVTVYRHYGNKRGLVRAVCARLAAIYQQAADEGADKTTEGIDRRLNRLGEEMRALPPGNLLARLEEIHRLYPDVYDAFRQARQSAIDRIAQQSLQAAQREHSLREGLNLEVARAIFLAAVFGLLEDSRLISTNVSPADLCATVTKIFRYGILKDPTGASNDGPRQA